MARKLILSDPDARHIAALTILSARANCRERHVKAKGQRSHEAIRARAYAAFQRDVRDSAFHPDYHDTQVACLAAVHAAWFPVA